MTTKCSVLGSEFGWRSLTGKIDTLAVDVATKLCHDESRTWPFLIDYPSLTKYTPVARVKQHSELLLVNCTISFLRHYLPLWSCGHSSAKCSQWVFVHTFGRLLYQYIESVVVLPGEGATRRQSSNPVRILCFNPLYSRYSIYFLRHHMRWTSQRKGCSGNVARIKGLPGFVMYFVCSVSWMFTLFSGVPVSGDTRKILPDQK